MKATIQVGDLVISHLNTLGKGIVGRPALVIDALKRPWSQLLRLKVGDAEWWEKAENCRKV